MLIQGNKADAYILDKAYDSDAVVAAAKRQGAEAGQTHLIYGISA